MVLNYEVYDHQRGSVPAYWAHTWSDCTWEFHNFWVVCERTLVDKSLVISDDAQRLGLASVVSQYFSSATIRLTDEQHSVLFPTN